ncbi:hypothetical protein [Mycobacteroides abscessus]|uniref:hypothetical protein n=1 Tax=Mycobacteroides abscessus TaxID=36809 RepID=UPI001041CDAD|nr:hypothetical protein [Mycobacteroides abscessus]
MLDELMSSILITWMPTVAKQGCTGHHVIMGWFAGGHPLDDCTGMDCVIHNPSGHHMRHWPQQWQPNGVLARICAHGQAHPDPDQFALWLAQGSEGLAIHECDGCCAYPSHTQTHHRTVADVESELSVLKMVRDLLESSGVPEVRPTAQEAALRTELRHLQHRDRHQ